MNRKDKDKDQVKRNIRNARKARLAYKMFQGYKNLGLGFTPKKDVYAIAAEGNHCVYY